MQPRDGVYPVGETEFSRVVELWEASVRATHDFVTADDIAVFRPLVREALGHDVTLACVRDADDLAIGFIGAAGGKIEMLFVDPAWFRRGVGARLLRHAIDELGCTEVDVNEQNAGAVRFYLRMGFEVVGRSELDSMGKEYPLLHMRLRSPAAPDRE